MAALCKALGVINDELKSSDWKALVIMKRTKNAPSVVDGIRASRIQREGFSSDMCNEAHQEEVLKRFKDTDSSGCGFGCRSHRRWTRDEVPMDYGIFTIPSRT